MKIGGLARSILKPLFLFRRKAPLLSYILGRLVTMAVLLFMLGLVIFGMMELAPGDIVSQVMIQQIFSGGDEGGRAERTNRTVSLDQYTAQRAALGLDQPFYVQYFRWLRQVLVHHNLGQSLISRAPVSFIISSRIVN